ncbi:MAG: tetratricopeptide repeat protein [Candidatus Aminicenantes bacterium]|nr:tetratricopeptide repeat protein [Candidatus Aminicenantes bacterium]NIM78227.1 tetratricopeptide repeat protein [Candidatus Aminicenantes bacterium]NIN23733.1 tetratricopeptide repeat protein [Candidatus Aminicenantes bacterium]NIN47440.1 tetratricopeptide repeat protein [Candidatus Aminicenantes bacterium]NIN90368.1 tetratricopeptide repeat protein [Candidatus Aminicenantes bacterium]
MNLKQWIQSTFASDKKKIIALLLALFALNFLLYLNTLHYDFLKDDFRLIAENPRIKDFNSFINTIGSKFFAFPDYPYLHYWRPVTLFSFYIDYQLWGLNASGYHLFNVLINAFNALLIFLIFYIVSKKILFSFFVSLFFSIHPSHVEAVSWISGRTDLLGAFFILAAILFFILFLKKKNGLFYLFTALFFLLALLSKENSVLFPLLAVGLIFIVSAVETDKTGKRVKHILKKSLVTLPFWVMDLIYIMLHNRFSGIQDVLANFSLKDIFVVFKTIGAYFKTILFPFFPTPYFSMHQFDRSHLEYLVYFGLALVVLVLLVVKRDKYKYSLYSLLVFIFLLPVLDPEIVPSYPKIVIRFAYIPAVWAGVFFIETFNLFTNNQLKKIFVALFALISVIWIFESYSFQGYFKDQYSHYNDVSGLTRHYPEDCSLLLPWALITAQGGDYNKALAVVDRALEVNHKDRWLDVSEMGGLLKANLLVVTGAGDSGKVLAESIMGKTRKDEMKYFGYLILAKYHEKKGELTASLRMLEKAKEIGETADLYFRKALIYGKMGDYNQALRVLRKAVTLNPGAQNYWQLEQRLINLINMQKRKDSSGS